MRHSALRDRYSPDTNHTIMAEALEKWKKELLEEAVPGLYEMIEQIDEALAKRNWLQRG